MNNIDNLQAGPELDRMVAEACGFQVECDESTRRNPVYNLGNWKYKRVDGFRPSADWNDAMLAAEKVGLFDNSDIGKRCTRSWNDANGNSGESRDWFVFQRQRPGKDVRIASTADTGPLAICRAILKAKQ